MSDNNKPLQTKVRELARLITVFYQGMVEEREFVVSKQLFRSGTSIAANQAEAQSAGSKKDFVARLVIASKECQETIFWLELIRDTKLVTLDTGKELALCNEVIRLLTKIIKTTKENINRECGKK